MTSESVFRMAFTILLALLFAMRFYFMYKVRRSGGRIMPGREAVSAKAGVGCWSSASYFSSC
jgi:hypothetical protein